MEVKIKNKPAFSFIEVVFSVFILSTGMVAVLGLMASSLKGTLDAKDQVIAGLLTQEGVELVRNIRDNNWAAGNGSFDNFPNNDAANCRLDKESSNINCSNDANHKKLSMAGNFYVHGSSPYTKFSRKIEVDYDTGNADTANSAAITSMVIWSGTSFPAIDQCDTINKCSYVSTVLSQWGE